MALSIQFQDNGTLHNDIFLRLIHRTFVCDSYWLAENQNIMPERDDAEKVRIVFTRLLEQWLAAIAQLHDGATVYLPFNLCDQCTGWLSCRRIGSTVHVTHCWSTADACSLCLTNLGDLFQCPQGLQADKTVVQMEFESLMNDIRASLEIARI